MKEDVMALKATIYKATVNVADMDRNQFLDAALTLARHPSETQERMMLRLLAWIKYADELGLPDEKRLKKACNQAKEVALFTYNSRAANIWWQQNQARCATFSNLSIWYLDDAQLAALSAFADDRTMNLQATLQDGAIWLSDASQNVEFHFETWQQP